MHVQLCAEKSVLVGAGRTFEINFSFLHPFAGQLTFLPSHCSPLVDQRFTTLLIISFVTTIPDNSLIHRCYTRLFIMAREVTLQPFTDQKPGMALR